MPARRWRRALRALALGGAAAAAAFAADAGSFSVSPTRLALTAAEPIVAVTVRNGDDAPAVIHLEVMAWQQADGVDRYEPSRELVATPPIFTLAPRGTQVVRIGLRRPAAPRQELAYRVYLTEVPAPPPPEFVGMRMALRLGVPVFVAPAVAGAQALSWQLRRDPTGGLSAVGANDGAVHARILDIALSSAGGAPAGAAMPVAADLHAGQQRGWPVPGGDLPSGARLVLTARTERGDVHADVVVP